MILSILSAMLAEKVIGIHAMLGYFADNQNGQQGLRPIPPSCYVKFAWYAAKHDSRLLRLQDMMRHVFTQCPCNTPPGMGIR